MYFYGATDTPIFDFWWYLLSGSYSHLAEAYMMYIPWDLHLVQHLLTSWWSTWQPVAVPHIYVFAEIGCQIWLGDLPHALTNRPPVTSDQLNLRSIVTVPTSCLLSFWTWRSRASKTLMTSSVRRSSASGSSSGNYKYKYIHLTRSS